MRSANDDVAFALGTAPSGSCDGGSGLCGSPWLRAAGPRECPTAPRAADGDGRGRGGQAGHPPRPIAQQGFVELAQFHGSCPGAGIGKSCRCKSGSTALRRVLNGAGVFRRSRCGKRTALCIVATRGYSAVTGAAWLARYSPRRYRAEARGVARRGRAVLAWVSLTDGRVDQ